MPLEETQGESRERRLERLEGERLELDDLLLDPLRLGGRDKERLESRYKELMDELSVLYDEPLPRPAPRLAAREGPVQVWLESETQDGFTFVCNAGLRITVLGTPSAVGHLAVREAETACTLEWALYAALRAVTRLAFERLNLIALQLQTPLDLGPLGFKDAGGNWWTLSRPVFERREGYLRRRGERRKPKITKRPRGIRRS
jgi:hypothetical protein